MGKERGQNNNTLSQLIRSLGRQVASVADMEAFAERSATHEPKASILSGL